MQPLRGPWPRYCRSASRRAVPHRRRRIQWPRRRPLDSVDPARKPLRLYALSKLVLDLDAEDCKIVRGFDPNIDGALETPEGAQQREEASVTRRVALFEQDHKRDEQAFEALRQLPVSPWHIADVDILSTVLEGTVLRDSDAAPKIPRHASPSELLSAICDMNGIPKSAHGTASNVVPYMLHRQKFVSPPDRAPAKFERLQKALATFNDFWEIQRFLLLLMKTPRGCSLASRLTHDLTWVLRRWAARGNPQEVADILALINNVSSTIAAKGLAADPTFTGLGLSLAMKCAAFPAARMYLENGFKNGNWDAPDTQLDLNTGLAQLLWLLSSHRRYTNESGLAVQQQIQAARLAAYGLLTGYHVGGQLTRHCYRATFPSPQSPVMPYWKHYLHVLGELGAFRTLWHEFQAVMRAPRRVHQSAVWSLHWFHSAMSRATQNIHSGRIRLERTSLTEASGDYATDCDLDLRTIMLSSESITPPRDDCSANIEPGHLRDTVQSGALAQLYSFEELPKEEAFESLVCDFFHQQDLQQAMAMLPPILFHAPPPGATG